jgi:scyllo-inositol 2-dehydrogenase (NADP+)
MIAARDRSGRMLSVFQNRRWDWDFLTLRRALANGLLGQPRIVESSVCRYAPPRAWRGQATSAGTILHDWGAHLVDQALQMGLGPCGRLTAWITPAPWPGVDTGGHGRIVMEFSECLFQVESSRICRLDRPRWWVVGTEAGYVKFGVDPQEDALRAGNMDAAVEPPEHRATLRTGPDSAHLSESLVETVRGSWDAYYANIADHLIRGGDLAVTAEQARDVVRVLDAANRSAETGATIEGPWGS